MCHGGAHTPDLLGFTTGSAYADVLNRLGTPSKMIHSKDKLSRIAFYDKWNAIFVFKQAKLEGYGIYDSEKGLPDFAQDWSFKE